MNVWRKLKKFFNLGYFNFFWFMPKNFIFVKCVTPDPIQETSRQLKFFFV